MSMTTILTNALLVFGGMLVGFLAGHMTRSSKNSRREAPAPVDIGYDEGNPINGKGRHGETVIINDYEWKIM